MCLAARNKRCNTWCWSVTILVIIHRTAALNKSRLRSCKICQYWLLLFALSLVNKSIQFVDDICVLLSELGEEGGHYVRRVAALCAGTCTHRDVNGPLVDLMDECKRAWTLFLFTLRGGGGKSDSEAALGSDRSTGVRGFTSRRETVHIHLSSNSWTLRRQTTYASMTLTLHTHSKDTNIRCMRFCCCELQTHTEMFLD